MVSRKKLLRSGIVAGCLGASALALVLNLPAGAQMHLSPIASAHAADDGEGGEGGKGAGYKGPHGMGEKGANRPGETVPGQGSGQGGPSADSDAKGPRYGGGDSAAGGGDGGGKPAWAQEGIPEGDYGRLNVARAPAKVIDRSLAEALVNLQTNGTELYTLTTLDAITQAILDGVYRVDSPLENLGLYKDLLLDSKISDGTLIPVTDANFVLLAGIFLGGAADKTIPITTDTVTAMNTILELTLPEGVTLDAVAAAAEAVRVAILDEHEG